MPDIHLILPESSARELDRLAEDLNESRNGLIRRALDQFFESERKRKVAEEMREYAAQMSKHSGEFVRQTGAVVQKKLLKETQW